MYGMTTLLSPKPLRELLVIEQVEMRGQESAGAVIGMGFLRGFQVRYTRLIGVARVVDLPHQQVGWG